VRSPSGKWEFYTDEDIVDGLIVFTGARSIHFDPPGFLPNDYINDLEVNPLTKADGEANQAQFVFVLSVSSVSSEGSSTEVTVRIVAEGIHLEDPNRPGLWIAE
jgi:hypothetical protein